VRAPDGGYPDVLAGSESFDLKLSTAYGLIDEVATKMGPEGPWDSPEAVELDKQTVATWLENNIEDPVVREIVAVDLSAYFGADPAEVSALFMAQFVAKCEGMRALQVSAQDSLWIGGSQQISQRIAEIDGVTALLDAPVSFIEWTEDGVTAHSAGGTVTGKALVLAVPLSASGTIRFEPALPLARRQLHARAPIGREVKIQLRYARPFWRDTGLSGEIFDTDLGCLAYDATRPGDEVATVVGFIGGYLYDSWAALSEDERKAAYVTLLTDAFGEEAAAPLEYIETDWPSVPFTMGAPVTYTPPGLLSSVGTGLTDPVGPIRFAGTESAPMWTGYMEGAVQAGEAAAADILEKW